MGSKIILPRQRTALVLAFAFYLFTLALPFIYPDIFQDKQSFAIIRCVHRAQSREAWDRSQRKCNLLKNMSEEKRPGRSIPSIECFINTGSDLIPLDPGSAGSSMYGEKAGGMFLPGAASATYGQYLGMVSRLLSQNAFAFLKDLLAKQHKPTPEVEKVSRIELISEKHGALYNVSRLRVHFADDVRSFAVNSAFSEEQQAFLQVEAKLLRDLHASSGLPYLPVPFIAASVPGLMVLIAEWFENHHEFHLSLNPSGIPAINVWKQGGKPQFLDAPKSMEIYAQVSRILTLYLDHGSFSQIYPWHHAAGDFIIDESQNPPSLRLITVRGYRPLLAKESDLRDKMLGSLHFFVNLTIRMRMDRLDGTGELAWATPQCLPGVIRGFVEGWETRRGNENLPKAVEIFSLFLDFSPDERLAFAEVVAADGRIEANEGDFLFPRLPGHVNELFDALKDFVSSLYQGYTDLPPSGTW